MYYNYAFDFTTHTLGSNSTAILGPSVVELIIFAALSWTVIVLVIIIAIFWYSGRGKQSIKDLDLEFYNQAKWEGLVLVPALDTVFSLGWCAPLDSVFTRLVCTIGHSVLTWLVCTT